jgi:hypothetical protein
MHFKLYPSFKNNWYSISIVAFLLFLPFYSQTQNSGDSLHTKCIPGPGVKPQFLQAGFWDSLRVCFRAGQQIKQAPAMVSFKSKEGCTVEKGHLQKK